MEHDPNLVVTASGQMPWRLLEDQKHVESLFRLGYVAHRWHVCPFFRLQAFGWLVFLSGVLCWASEGPSSGSCWTSPATHGGWLRSGALAVKMLTFHHSREVTCTHTHIYIFIYTLTRICMAQPWAAPPPPPPGMDMVPCPAHRGSGWGGCGWVGMLVDGVVVFANDVESYGICKELY